jgi:undecaprenyl diphosphate synthase
MAEVIHDSPGTPDVDLLVRTGGELRLSDLFGWDSGYAELVFSKTMWPDFGGEDLRSAVEEFRTRERRFGALPQTELRQASAARLNGV